MSDRNDLGPEYNDIDEMNEADTRTQKENLDALDALENDGKPEQASYTSTDQAEQFEKMPLSLDRLQTVKNGDGATVEFPNNETYSVRIEHKSEDEVLLRPVSNNPRSVHHHLYRDSDGDMNLLLRDQYNQTESAYIQRDGEWAARDLTERERAERDEGHYKFPWVSLR